MSIIPLFPKALFLKSIGICSLMFAAYGSFAQDVAPELVVAPKLFTSPVHRDADDPTIWIHPTDPARSVVIGTDKSSSKGGLFVWDLDGRLLQYIPLRHPNNVDLRRDINVDGRLVDIVAVNLRPDRQIKVYEVNPTNGWLTDLTTTNGIHTPELRSPYGFCLYRRPADGAVFAIESSASSRRGQKNLFQYRLEGDGLGRVKGTFVRVIGTNSIQSVVEGLVADDDLGHLYASDENKAVRKYRADPDAGDDSLITSFAMKQDGIRGDREGLALYKCPDGTGYLLLSSQGNATVKVYRREGEPGEPHRHPLLATIKTTGSSQTDGLDVTSSAAGTNFPSGFIIKHNARKKNFALYSWEDVAQSFLKICVDNAR